MSEAQKFNKKKYFLTLAVVAVVWGAVYSVIIPVSKFLTYDLFSIEAGSHLGASVEFFIYDTAKILMLLVGLIYVIAWIRSAISIERIRDFLMGKKRIFGYALGSFFGAVTPFCSCSSIPLFLGFISARIPLGITMAFLITSPLINEVAIVMLWGILGWKFTIVYVTVGIVAGIAGGFIMDLLKAERWLQPFLLQHLNTSTEVSGASTNQESAPSTPKLTIEQRHQFAYQETRDIVKRVWKWIILGVAVGAALHGYMPEEWVSQHLGDGQWWSVPLAVFMGMPLYSNVTGIIPVMESLLLKGLPIGTTLALCMSTIVISIPELMMLKQVMRWQLLALFVVLVIIIFTLVGWFFNAVSFLL